MAGLHRSDVSFRRQGSSGLVWDDKFLSGELNQLANQKEDGGDKSREESKEASASAVRIPSPADGWKLERSRSDGGRGFRTSRASLAIEPPSPKVSVCGFCGAFRKGKKTRRRAAKTGERVR